jgi:flagellar FliL protein
MAKEEAAPETQAPKSKKKLLIVIIAVVLVLALAGGGAAFFLLGKKPDAEQQAEHDEEEEANAEAHPPVYEKLETFTVNLADGETFLQVEISLLLADLKAQEKVKMHMPEVRDALLRLLSGKSPDELATTEGKDKLAAEVQVAVNEILGVKKASKGVKKVLFNGFIIQ